MSSDFRAAMHIGAAVLTFMVLLFIGAASTITEEDLALRRSILNDAKAEGRALTPDEVDHLRDVKFAQKAATLAAQDVAAGRLPDGGPHGYAQWRPDGFIGANAHCDAPLARVETSATHTASLFP